MPIPIPNIFRRRRNTVAVEPQQVEQAQQRRDIDINRPRRQRRLAMGPEQQLQLQIQEANRIQQIQQEIRDRRNAQAIEKYIPVINPNETVPTHLAVKDEVPQMKKGGLVKKTQVVKVHKGELIIPANRVKAVEKAVKDAGLKPLKK